MDDKYTAITVRQTWDEVAGRAFEQAGAVRLKAADVRKFVSNYMENEAKGSTSKRKFWDMLSEEDKQRILEKAFPVASYTRPEKGNVFICAAASVDTRELRETLEDRGFDPFTLQDVDTEAGSWSDLINDSIDKADLVLLVVPHNGSRNPNVFIELGYALAKKKRILALVAPDEELPLVDIPYLRTELDDKETIGFGLDGVLAARKGKGKWKSRRNGVKKTRPLGTKADGLLKEARANHGQISEAELMNIVRRAIEGSGVSTVVSEPQAAVRSARTIDRGVDFAVWSEDLEPLIKNPVVIELKSRLRGKKQFEEAIAQLSRALDTTHTQVGLLIYTASDSHIEEELSNDPRILVFSLEDFLSLLKENGFGDLLRRARNVRVHGGS